MEQHYEVEAVIGKRVTKFRNSQYLIKWKGYPFEQSTWEGMSHCKNIKDMLWKFNDKIKGKPLPYTEEAYQKAIKKSRRNKKQIKYDKGKMK